MRGCARAEPEPDLDLEPDPHTYPHTYSHPHLYPHQLDLLTHRPIEHACWCVVVSCSSHTPLPGIGCPGAARRTGPSGACAGANNFPGHRGMYVALKAKF